MTTSRVKNSITNFTIATIAQLVTIVFSFISRTVFINIMNADYLGVNGLFSNVLAILSFSEMGLSAAIIYNMYKPIAKNDFITIGSLLRFYKTAYRYLALFMFLVGLGFMPFIDYLASSPPNITENLKIIYFLFLLQTVSSYIFSYNRSLYTASQREYYNIIVERSVWIIMYVIQIIYIYLTHDFYGYLIVHIIATVAVDLIISYKAKKQFPMVYDNNVPKLTKIEVKKIMRDVSSLFFYKIGSTILHSTDNIIIAKIINITIVGICSNYVLIISSIEAILQKALNSIVASIGNLNASDLDKVKMKVLNELTLASNWIYGLVSICLFVGLNDLIVLWLGEEYVLSDWKVIFALVLSFFVFGSNFTASSFRLTMGFFKESRFVPLIAAVVNLALSIVLGNIWGLFGIYVSTAISRFFTFCLIDPFLAIKKGLNLSPFRYYFNQVVFLLVTFIVGVSCFYFGKCFKTGILPLLLKLVFTLVFVNVAYFAFYFRTIAFKGLLNRLLVYIKK